MGDGTMNNHYDVIVVGAGPAGIFTCYELTLKLPGANVLLIDKGHDIYKRNCPILQKKLRNARRQPAKKIMPAVCPPVRSRTALAGLERIRTASSTSRANLAAG